MRTVLLMSLVLSVATQHVVAQTTTPSVSPEADALVEQIEASYSRLRSLRCSGTVSLDAKVLDRPTAESKSITTHYAAPNRFRSEMKDGALVVSTGTRCFLFVPRLLKYIEAPAPPRRADFDSLPQQLRTALARQDPSLYLAVCPDPRAELLGGALRITRTPDSVIDGVAHPTLLFEQADEDITIAVDPATHLIRRVQLDHRKLLGRHDVPAPEKALVTIDYTEVRADGPVDGAVFEWSPPGNANPLPPPATQPLPATRAED